MRQRPEWHTEREFELEAIRIARLLWPNAGVSGAIVLNGLERDGLFITDDAVHIIECTVSRSKQKAIDDIDKSIKLARQLRREHPNKVLQIWFVTAEEPTGDQQSVANSRKEFKVTAIAYDAFRAKLIDAASYLQARAQYAFGSARNLKDDSANVPPDAYVSIDLLRLNDSSIWSADKLTQSVISGEMTKALLLADYGAGKSMTLRQLYFGLEKAYKKGLTTKFPVFLNLRDHSGQTDTVEVLERHARRIGFARPDHLVRAWRAGYAVLILDGFDELSSTGWMAFNKKLRSVRYNTTEIVRRFVDESPKGVSIFISGRVSYFDSDEECLTAIGLIKDQVSIFSLNDFTIEQIQAFFKKNGVNGELPEWLPARPLLIGYLVVRGAISPQFLRNDGDAGEGWNNLLEAVCEREARTHANIDASTLRQVLERLATIVRTKGGIYAPLLPGDMIAAFRAVVGVDPDEKAETLLMRLPGMGPSPGTTGGRAFIDSEFASACAAGEVVDYIENPYGQNANLIGLVQEVLTDSGVSVALNQIQVKAIPEEKVYASFRRAVVLGDKEVPNCELAGDLLKIVAVGLSSAPKERLQLQIKETLFDEIDFSDLQIDLSGIELRGCVLGGVVLPVQSEGDHKLPAFIGCEISHVEGRSSSQDLKADRFRDCSFDTFSESFVSNAAVANLALDPGLKALVTILRKLFVQKGAGRKENAFYRGVIGVNGNVISEVLALVERAGYATKSKRGGQDPVWNPNRRMSGRVKAILSAPSNNRESIVMAAREIGRE